MALNGSPCIINPTTSDKTYYYNFTDQKKINTQLGQSVYVYHSNNNNTIWTLRNRKILKSHDVLYPAEQCSLGGSFYILFTYTHEPEEKWKLMPNEIPFDTSRSPIYSALFIDNKPKRKPQRYLIVLTVE